MVGWVGSVALSDALLDAPCGCDLEETAAASRDDREAAVFRADAAIHRAAWRCPRIEGGIIAPDALDDAHQTALTRARAVTGCTADEMRTCPGHYARTDEAHEVVVLMRWQKSGQLQLRMPNPTGAVVDAIDVACSALAAREADEIERMKRTPQGSA